MRKIFAMLALIFLLFSAPYSSVAQTQPNKQPKKLADKDNPDMIGKRDINNNQLNFTSLEDEIKIGQQLANEIDRQAKFVTDQQITEYVNRLGQNIAINSDAKVPFTIKVIDSMDVNAFALPGGFFYVCKGLLINAESESEIACVMAHEIAHVACRHAMEQQAKGRLVNLISLPIAVMGGPLAPIIMGLPGGIGIPLIFLKFSRGMEEEADHYGAQYAYKTGYDPKSLVDIFDRLQKNQKTKSAGGFAGIFSSHPNHKTRIEKVQKFIVKLPEKDEYAYSSSDFVEMKRKLKATTSYLGSGDNSNSSDPQTVNGKPTLKRRTDNTISNDPNNHDVDQDIKPDTDDKKSPPTLKRNNPPKDEEEKPNDTQDDPDDDGDDD